MFGAQIMNFSEFLKEVQIDFKFKELLLKNFSLCNFFYQIFKNSFENPQNFQEHST